MADNVPKFGPEYSMEKSFSTCAKEALPLIEKLYNYLQNEDQILSRQKWAIDNNHRTIVDQEKKISENMIAIESAKKSAESIIAMANDKRKEVEVICTSRMAETAQRERESKQRLEKLEKDFFELENKRRK